MSLTIGLKDNLVLGDYNVICDACGMKFKAKELRKRWDGYMVCPSDFEQRHPQDLIRLRPERQAVPWARPQGTDTFRVPTPADPDSL